MNRFVDPDPTPLKSPFEADPLRPALPVDPLLPRSSTQAMKALLAGEQLPEPWPLRLQQAIARLFTPARRTV